MAMPLDTQLFEYRTGNLNVVLPDCVKPDPESVENPGNARCGADKKLPLPPAPWAPMGGK